ncbi:hypothetical protein, partial [Nocardioides sp. NPDC006273]|uniref:hypothetical protein n=1 Tax=Nocardioides sp. NPDC006273 TaxID=3155598 RepID=UPI0033BEDEF9
MADQSLNVLCCVGVDIALSDNSVNALNWTTKRDPIKSSRTRQKHRSLTRKARNAPSWESESESDKVWQAGPEESFWSWQG